MHSRFAFFVGIFLTNIFLLSLAEAHNHSIIIDTSTDLVLRYNQTLGGYESYVFHVFAWNMSNFTQPFKFTFSNSTNNISFSINQSPSIGASYCGQTFSQWGSAQLPQYIGRQHFSCSINLTQQISKGTYNITVNVTDLFNNTHTAFLPVKATPNYTAAKTYYTGGGNSIDAFNDTNMSLSFSFEPYLYALPFTFIIYAEDPGIPAYDPFNISRFVEIVSGWEQFGASSTQYVDWVKLDMKYYDSDVSRLGLEESSLELSFYNETYGSWQPCQGSSVDTVNNIVSCNTTHMSTWTITGDPVQVQPPSPAPQISSGGGGGAKKTITNDLNQSEQTQNVESESTNAVVEGEPTENDKIAENMGENLTLETVDQESIVETNIESETMYVEQYTIWIVLVVVSSCLVYFVFRLVTGNRKEEIENESKIKD